MKKLLVITNHSYMLYQFRRELLAELLKAYDVVISTPFVGHEHELAAMPCRLVNTAVDRRGINPIRDLKLFKTYRALIKQEKPDMVITYSIKPNLYGAFAAQQSKIPYVVNVQGLGTAFQKPGIAQLVTLMYRVALRKAQTVFFENKGNAQLFLDKHIIPSSKITVLNGAGVNLEHYAKMPYPEDGKLHFLYLGRIMKEKGIDELFQAARRLHENYGDRFVLDLVGFYEDEYQATVADLQKDGIAVFHGFQSDPRSFYHTAHCVVLPSYHEGMSNVLLEAAATGRPVITTRIHGCLEAAEEGKTGLLCTVKDTDSLYTQLQQFLLMSYDTKKQMGILAREKMEKDFDKNLVVKETINKINHGMNKD